MYNNDASISELEFSFDIGLRNQYPFNIPALSGLTKLQLHPQVTFFVGENGTGKSTLIEAIAVALGFNAEGGTKNFNFSSRASHSDLYKYLKFPFRTKRHKDGFFLRSESFFNLATQIEDLDKEPSAARRIIDSYGGKSLHEQSHGESFWALFLHRFSDDGLYIFDEPEAAMSPSRQMAMLCRMQQMIENGSQFIIATHSPILIAYPNALIYEFSQDGIVTKSYKETELFNSYYHFLHDSDNFMTHLLHPKEED